jgi:hypothetical protein
MSATTCGLQVPLRSDGDLLNRVFAAANFHRTFEAPPLDAGVVELITEALFRPLQKGFLRDPCSHFSNLWAVVGNVAQPVIRLHAPSSLQGRQSAWP